MRSCCPPNADKFLAPDYSFVGQTHAVEDGVEFYVTGTAGDKAVMLLPDIFGWNGGRTRNIADFLAEEGYYVVVPKLLVPPVDGGVDGDGTMFKFNTCDVTHDSSSYNRV
jgi:dienelactone hydrolase